MARLDPRESFDVLKDRVTEAISSNFPREGSKHILKLENVQIKDDLDMNDIAAQKKAKLRGTTFGVPVKATMVLEDKETGKVLEKKTLKVATLPKYTRRHSFVVKGAEYQVDSQWRLKPGIYTRVAQNGELQSRFNFQGKQSLDMTFDPKTKVFRMKHGGSKPPLYPILKAVGIDDDTMQAAWGKDILNANKTTARGKALNVDKLAINFAKRLDPRAEVKTFDDASGVINAYMGDAELREDVTKLTLGKGFKKITPEVLTRSSKRLLGVARGEEKPDVRDALMFKDLLSVEDFIAERMGEGTKTIQRRIGNNLDRKSTIREIVGPDVFDRPIREFFSKSSLANTPQQTNPLEMLSGQQRTTITGEGGVKDAHKIMEDAKLVDPSHFGILDPLHTPESSKTGVSLHLSTSAVKRGKTVALPLVNVKTGKVELLDPKQISEQIIAMPDEGKWKDGKWKPKGSIIKASTQGNEIREVKAKDVKYVMGNTGQMFSVATNMVPFLNSDSPNRSTMAGRHMEQAIPLKNPEAPLVQSDRGDGRTYDEFVGRYASHETPDAGKVTKIEPGAIHIKGVDGKSQKIQIYDNYPLNDKKGVLHSTPAVKVGQQVKKGQLIADSNFTDKGVYAPGTNMKVGYTPWKGYNFEDGVVISDTAAQRLTSEHLYKKSLFTQDAQAVGLKKFTAYKSTALNEDQIKKLGDDGIIQPGVKVTKGDTLIAALSEKAPTTEAQMLKNLHRSLANPYDDRSVTWDQDHEGEVVSVSKSGKAIQVHVRTAEPMEIGDKLCYDEKTDVLTTEGWKSIENVTIVDRVCCLVEGVTKYRQPTETFSYPRGGRMYRIKSQQVDLFVTACHHMFVRRHDHKEYELIEAEKLLGERVHYVRRGIGLPIVELEEEKVLVEELTEGYDRPVYCITVPDHVLYVRRNGKPVWSGNSNRHGGKGIVARILPDHEMPQTKDGKAIEIVMNPIGVAGRMNVGQILETAAGKLAEKEGKPYKVQNFGNEDNRTKVEQDLKKAKISDKETIIDPVNNKEVPGVLVGNQYIIKLQHQVEKKMMSRSRDGYDRNLVPKGGGPHGAQALGSLGIYAMLSHGATANIREMATQKSDKAQSDEVWAALQAGEPIPPPQTTFAYKKFESYLKGMGINVEKDGNSLNLMPLTDKQVEEMSNGELKDAGRAIRGYKIGSQRPGNIEPEKSGLFDPRVTGGLDGMKWCFHPLTRVVTDQGLLPIGRIVEEQLQVRVLSQSPAGKLEWKGIHNYWKNKVNVDLVSLQYETRGHLSGYQRRSTMISALWCTPRHEIYTSDGKVPAKNAEGTVATLASHSLSKAQEQLVLGSLLGDAYLEGGSAFGNRNWMFRCSHGPAQLEYLEMKVEVLSEFVDCPIYDQHKPEDGKWKERITHGMRTIRHPAFSELYDIVYQDQRKTVTKEWLDRLDERGLAYWFFDDGSVGRQGNKIQVVLCTHSFYRQEVTLIQEWLADRWGIRSSSSQPKEYDGKEYGWAIHLSSTPAQSFLQIVAPYTPSCLRYKTELEYVAGGCGTGGTPIESVTSITDSFVELRALVGSKLNALYGISAPNTVPVIIRHVDQSGTKRFSKCRTVYNIEVEGNHNYFANGILVGNSHISLAEALPNPVFEKAAKSVAGVRGPQFNRLISGEAGVTDDGKIVPRGTKGATFGPQSVGKLLDTVDVKADLEKVEARLPNLKGQPLNEARRKVKYLRALKKLDMSPRDAYMMKKVPVMPPAMRPLSTMEDGGLQFDDLNQLYKDVALLDQQLREQPSYSPESIKAEPRADLYDRMKALTGMGGSLKGRYKGIANIIAGDSPKYGFVQEKLIKRKQDLTMRSTIIPEPSLSLDDIAIPRKAATELYKPFVVREMRTSTGMGPLTAKQLLEGDPDHPLVKSSLQRVVEDRPLLVKRDPALHKYNIQAFQPKLVEGKAIKIHPLICSGMSADFDGNCCAGSSRIALTFDPEMGIRSLTDVEEVLSMKFSGRTKVIESTGDGYMMEIDIADFPRTIKPVTYDRNGNPVFGTPRGLRVLSYDHTKGAPVFCEVTGVTIEQDCPVVEVKGRRHSVTASDNESMCLYDHGTGEVVKESPVGAEGRLMPVVARVPNSNIGNYDFDYGWMIGAFVSDGFFMGSNESTVGYSKVSTEHRDKFFRALRQWESGKLRRATYAVTHGEENGITGDSTKDHISGIKDLASLFMDCYDPSREHKGDSERACLYKRLPVDVIDLPTKALYGVLSGLLDGDGHLSQDKRGRVVAQIQTSSLYLVNSVKLLCHLLGIRVSVTTSPPKEGRLQTHDAYVISLSRVDVERDSHFIRLIGEGEEILCQLRENVEEGYCCKDDRDIVPVPAAIMKFLASKNGPAGRSLRGTLATIKSKTKGKSYVARETARRMVSLLPESFEGGSRWVQLVEATDIQWDIIQEVIPRGRIEVFDLIIPETKVFAVNGGLVVWDTMSAYVPMTGEAVDEARKMFPSRILFNPATANVMYAPSHESQVGLFLKSEVGKTTRLRFEDKAELQVAVKAGKLGAGDVATVGKIKTTLDRVQIDATLPKKLQGGKLLTDMKYLFTKGEQNQLFGEMARADKNGYAKNIDRMKDLGNLKATHSGFSFGLEDFKVHKNIRDPLLQDAARKTSKLNLDKPEDMEKFVEAYEGAMKKMQSKLKAQAKVGKNPLDKLEVSAGIKGKGYTQLTGAPVLFVDAKGDVVPSPVRRSYSEGLSAADYWASASGGRKGVVQKVQSVSEPGYLTKLMMNSTMNTLVSEEDCGTSKGISLSLDEPDIVGRFTTSSVKVGKTTIPSNTMVTPEVVNKIRNSKVSRVLVRSPMRCNHAKGVCKKCAGLNEHGELHDLGTNIGVLSAQAIGERGTQLAMRSFHTGGLFEGRTAQEKSISGGGLDRAMTILHMPKKVKGSAKLSVINGKIGAIRKDPAGGMNIMIGDTSHYVPADRRVLTKIKKGGSIKKGDPITAGPINPHELLPLTNMNKVQGYLASELHSIYAPEGIRRRNSEVIVRSLSNVTKVENPGDNEDFIIGDFAPTSVINDWNKKNRRRGKLPVRHTPVLKGVKQIPLDVQTDWLARLNHENLRGTIVAAAQQGWTSQLHGEHPIPPLIYGAEFGKGTKEKPWAY